MQNINGKLYIIATPIGNLADITLRALETLKKVNLILCEDTRVTAKLLNHYSIKKPLLVYNDHSEEKTRLRILEVLKKGEDVALVSDAGTPLISDPGYKLVQLLKEDNIEVIPGPCSVIAALCLAGIATNRFMFIGFLPHKLNAKEQVLIELKNYNTSIIFFEAANRLEETLGLIAKIAKDSEVAVVKEITKIHQQVIRDKPENIIKYFQDNPDRLRGEIIVVLEMKDIKDELEEIELLLKKLLESMSVRDAVEVAASQFNLPKKQIYKLAVAQI